MRWKPGGKAMQQEAADEFLRRQSHNLARAGIAIVLPAKRDLAVFQRQQPVVGNRHAMGVAAEILDDMERSAEGGLGVDHPFRVAERGTR